MTLVTLHYVAGGTGPVATSQNSRRSRFLLRHLIEKSVVERGTVSIKKDFEIITSLTHFVCRHKLKNLDSCGAKKLFLPARRYASAVFATATCTSVCVCLSVCHTPVLCLAERKQDREMYTV